MTLLADQYMLNTLADGHARLSRGLDVAAKVHMLLPEGVTLQAWQVVSGEVMGQVAALDDATAIAWVHWMSQMPGWRFEQSPPKSSRFLSKPYIRIAAVTDVDGMPVKIWAHIAADVQPATENGAAA